MGRHPLVTGILFVVLAVLVAAGFELLRIKRDLEAGSRALAELSLESLDAGLVPTVARAASSLTAAEERARTSPFLELLSVVPGAADQVDAVRDLSRVGAELGTSALATARTIDRDLRAASGSPPARLTLIDTVLEELHRLEAQVEDTDIGAEGTLLGPLADGRRVLETRLAEMPERFDDARRHLSAIRTLLDGPSRYLLLAGNNAEMRGFGGMPLSGGLVTFEDGDITFGKFQKTAYRFVHDFMYALAGRRPPLPEHWAETYREWRIGFSWLDTAVTPIFPKAAPIYQGMAYASPLFLHAEVDGVIVVDPVALRFLLDLIGPVEVEGVEYTAENVEQLVLNQHYLDFETFEARDQRNDVQGQLAGAIFDALKTRDVPITKMALTLSELAERRHLLAWSDDPALQGLWETVGADGAIDPYGMVVTVQNRGGTKFDWYIDPRVDIASRRDPDGSLRVGLTVTVPNDVPPDTPQLMNGVGLPEGVYSTFVGVYLPEAAYDIETVNRHATDMGPDPPLHLVGTRFQVPRGETKHFTVTFSVPADHPGFVVYPAGRVRPTVYNVNGVSFTDELPVFSLWSPPPGDEPLPLPIVLAAVLCLAGAACLLYGTRRNLARAPGGGASPAPVPVASGGVALPAGLRRLTAQAPALGLALFALAAATLFAQAVLDGLG